MRKTNYETLKAEAIDLVSGNAVMFLATCSDDRVTARAVSIVNDGLRILFQTDRAFTKCGQIKRNPNVALCSGNVQIEGVARITCHPLEHEFFREEYRRRHERAFGVYSHMEDEVVTEVEPTLLTLLKHDAEHRPFRDSLDVKRKQACRQYYRKAK